MTLKEEQKRRRRHRSSSIRGGTSNVPGVDEQAIQKQHDDEFEERLLLLKAVEEKILPSNFGNQLYRICFLTPSDTSVYDIQIGSNNNSNNNDNGDVEDEDEYTRIAKLEKFFEGLADGTRRGSKTAVKCLIKCCQPQDPPSPEPSSSDNNMGPAPSNDFAYGTTSGMAYNNSNNQSTNSTTKTYIQPMEFVTIGYRIALAAAFLKATTTTSAGLSDDRC